MKIHPLKPILGTIAFALSIVMPSHAFEVIAHRGASGYLPENTRESFAYAHALGADWIESDVVATKDGALLINHDLALDSTTDALAVFPGKKRPDGHIYAIDLTMEEVGQLRVKARQNAEGKLDFPKRFPDNGAIFHLITLEQEIQLVQGLNKATGKDMGLYIEIKAPKWHKRNGIDIAPKILACLQQYQVQKAILESFDPDELQRIKGELKSPYPQTQLIGQGDELFDPDGEKFDSAALQTPEGLKKIAQYAQNIGPHLGIILGLNLDGSPKISPLIADAHAAGLKVHPYVFRSDVPPFVPPLAQRAVQVLQKAGIDGLFTDQPDVVRQALQPAP